MARKGKSTEEIIGFLREAEVRIAQGRRRARSAEVRGSRSKPSAQGNIDCGAFYKATTEQFHKQRAANLAPDKVAEFHRLALRAYDACTAGDQFKARNYWDEVERWSRAKPEK
jgi:hypothetical protein